MTAAMLMPSLLLQKPYKQSKAKEHVECLKRGLKAWKEGDFEGLLKEGRAIQNHLTSDGRQAQKEDSILRTLSKLMLLVNIRGALRLVSASAARGVLPLSATIEGKPGCTVRDILKEKHPDAAPIDLDAVQARDQITDRQQYHPVLFDYITGDLIRVSALRAEGAAGPAGIDAAGWRRMCTSFQGASSSLCNAVATFTRRLCTSYIDPSTLSAFTACRLIPLN